MNPTFSDLVLGWSELKNLLTQPSQHIVFAIIDAKNSYQPYGWNTIPTWKGKRSLIRFRDFSISMNFERQPDISN